MSNPTVKKLTEKDIRKLKKQQNMLLVFFVFVLLISVTIVYFLSEDFKLSDKTSTYIMIGFPVLIVLSFGGILFFIGKKLITDIQNKEKLCFEGVIENKSKDVSTSGKGSNKTSYYIILNNSKHKIDFQEFRNCNVGDTVYLEKSPNAKVILNFTILKNASNTEATERSSFEANETLKEHEAPLKMKDQDAIKSVFRKKIINKLLLNSPLLFISFGLIATKMGGLLLFLFPIPIILIYQLIKSFRLFLNYKKALEHNRKKVITTIVEDKFTSKFKSSSEKNYLKSKYGTVLIPSTLFKEITAGDEVQIHIPLHFKYPIAFSYNLKTYYLQK